MNGTKIRQFQGLAAFALIIILVSCQKDNDVTSATVPADFLPQQGDIEGWDKGTGVGDYLEASDQSSLYDIIDGGAEVYISYGFVEGVQQKYYGTILASARTLSLFIADMGTLEGAYNLFHDLAITPTSFSPLGYGDEARLDEGLLFDYALDFRLSHYYIKLILNKEGAENEALQILELFASTVEMEING